MSTPKRGFKMIFMRRHILRPAVHRRGRLAMILAIMQALLFRLPIVIGLARKYCP